MVDVQRQWDPLPSWASFPTSGAGLQPAMLQSASLSASPSRAARGSEQGALFSITVTVPPGPLGAQLQPAEDGLVGAQVDAFVSADGSEAAQKLLEESGIQLAMELQRVDGVPASQMIFKVRAAHRHGELHPHGARGRCPFTAPSHAAFPPPLAACPPRLSPNDCRRGLSPL